MDITVKEQTDVLVIGAGLTGLRAALAAARLGVSVTVLSKGPRCSAGVMGFNAAVGREDDPELYWRDIQVSGQGLSDPALARVLAVRSSVEAAFLESLGLILDKTEDGHYDLLQPLGCSVPRLVHRGRVTGAEAEQLFLRILRDAHVSVRFDTEVLELLSDGEQIAGVLAIEAREKLVCYPAGAVVLAAGGCGALYPVTTYPTGIRGDAYALAARAGAVLTDMEFMQFEPCCLTAPASLIGKGISTTMLHAGGRLINACGHDFLPDYFPHLASVQKGELARAIFAEKKKCGGKDVLYDLTALSADELEQHCLWTKELRQQGLDPLRHLLPVAPAAHTFLGGVKTDSQCRTSLRGLFAAGEAMGGLHGANRLGGCAGAETFVFGAVAGENAARFPARDRSDIAAAAVSLAEESLRRLCTGDSTDFEAAEAAVCQLRNSAAENLSLIRRADGLAKAKKQAAEVSALGSRLRCRNPQELALKNGLCSMALTMEMIAAASELRKESRGVFFREDHPTLDSRCQANIQVHLRNGEIAVAYAQAEKGGYDA